MYWEPAQSKHLHAEEDNDDSFIRKAPGKWTPKWTGPHPITKVSPGTYNPRFQIYHTTRKRKIDDLKEDKMTPYQPWSNAMPSTSPDLDTKDGRSFKIGSWCNTDDMVLIALEKPYPFGVGKILEADKDGRIEFQWFTSTHDTQATKPFLPMWSDGQRTYAATAPSHEQHTPYTNLHDDMPITQTDIVLHGFLLSKSNRIPVEVLDECHDNPNVWWTRRSRK